MVGNLELYVVLGLSVSVAAAGAFFFGSYYLYGVVIYVINIIGDGLISPLIQNNILDRFDDSYISLVFDRALAGPTVEEMLKVAAICLVVKKFSPANILIWGVSYGVFEKIYSLYISYHYRFGESSAYHSFSDYIVNGNAISLDPATLILIVVSAAPIAMHSLTLFLSASALITRRLSRFLTAIAVHILNNGIAVGGSYLISSYEYSRQLIFSASISVLLLIFYAISIIVIYRRFDALCERRVGDVSHPKDSRRHGTGTAEEPS